MPLTAGPVAAVIAGGVVVKGADEVLGDALHRRVGREGGRDLQEDRVVHHHTALAARRRGGSAGRGLTLAGNPTGTSLGVSSVEGGHR